MVSDRLISKGNLVVFGFEVQTSPAPLLFCVRVCVCVCVCEVLGTPPYTQDVLGCTQGAGQTQTAADVSETTT